MYILYNSVLRNTEKEVEGVGSIYFRIISLIAFCRYHNFNFIHFKHHIGHNYDNVPDDVWDTQWDNFFNISSLCNKLDDINIEDYEIIRKHELEINDIDNLIENKHNNKLFYFLHYFPIFFNNSNTFLKLVEDDLIKVYNEANFNKSLIFNKNKKNIAIHVRVWNDYDTTDYNNFINCFIGPFQLNESNYIHIINKLIFKYPDYDINIFSQNSFIKKFPNIFQNKNLIFHLEMDAMNTFNHLVNSDILVLGYSCFSHLAGIYNKNIVYYTNYPYIPKLLDRWINIFEI